ncbi:MAG: amidohydrolase family protein [Micrococcales bacterium]|nr:amidohydrolase family protein [Micrococcales bacterium]
MIPDHFPANSSKPWAVTGAVVTPGAVVEAGVVVVLGETIVWVGAVREVPDGFREAVAAAIPAPLVLPGLVDIHCHGGGGASFPDAASVDEARLAVREHLRSGTTSLIASTVTQDRESLLRQMALLAQLADSGELVALHAEGPFLSPKRAGIQNPAFMQEPDPGLVYALAEAARGHLATMTIAPEIPGNMAANTSPGTQSVIAAIVSAGAVPSFGHTDCSAEDINVAISEALAAGATRSPRPTVTHLFNAMRPFAHRDPGPPLAALAAAEREEVAVELVGDSVHLAPEVVSDVFGIAGADNVLLVSDAMAAAGMPDGIYRLGPMDVEVKDRVARMLGGTAIASSTARSIDLVRCSVFDAGIPIADAVCAASRTPARVLGVERRVGALEVGLRADLVLTDRNFEVLAVVKTGQKVA